LMSLVPASYAIDRHASADDMSRAVQAARSLSSAVEDAEKTEDSKTHERCEEAASQLTRLADLLQGHGTVADIPREGRFEVRQAILLADKAIGDVASRHGLDKEKIAAERAHLRALVDYAPRWVLVAIAVSLGIGTMVGWKRIVVTVGERIGNQRLTYAQGASAGLVATATIGLSAGFGLPVSTTHVLSSGIAGTMVAEGAGVQGGTVRNIALAWILTLPVSMLLAGTLYLVLRLFLI
ncbi:MAG: inorganic phosphate transporter, partial [Clostridia bacterium]|nr:inorganic phosphate transporter [Deltaproteobacteria bacterium]